MGGEAGWGSAGAGAPAVGQMGTEGHVWQGGAQSLFARGVLES